MDETANATDCDQDETANPSDLQEPVLPAVQYGVVRGTWAHSVRAPSTRLIRRPRLCESGRMGCAAATKLSLAAICGVPEISSMPWRSCFKSISLRMPVSARPLRSVEIAS